MNQKNTILIVFLCVAFFACIKKVSSVSSESPSLNDLQLEKDILSKTAIKMADGLKINLWASDSLAPDPIAISIDNRGRVFITRTNRQKNSEFDIRGHRNWMTSSISFQDVEDRRKFIRSVFDPEKSSENTWLKDLNGDGSHDWRDLTVEKDEVWRIEDTNGDGRADRSVQVINDFHEEITDVAGALLVRENDAFVGIGPDLWRMEDTDGDGFYDKKTSISHGYAVHIGFGGHGMSGLVEGPDGKIYWGIGDIGASLIDQTGKKHHYPNQGVIVRCNPDGSNFEVFSHGHRNTHEFTFDQFGTIISSDNDGDHPGESERLVHIVEGSDSGWRANWQYGKYTDPKNNKYNVWMDEKLSVPYWEGQASYIIPPIQNYHNGPTGMVFNPGTALGTSWLNKFFLVEFTGTPSRAHIWSFSLKPKGATYLLDQEIDMLNGVLATGIRFGPDGALYVADWINGWGTKNYGRVWKLDVTDNSLEMERKSTLKWLQTDLKTENTSSLQELLEHKDQRVRQKSQFELVRRGESSMAVFENTLKSSANQLARIHAVWGIGQLMEKNASLGKSLINYLSDADSELIAQVCKVMGQYYYNGADAKLIQLLLNNNPRVQFYAAEALGRNKEKSAVEPLIELLKKNNDNDLYIRHACVLALSRIGDDQALIALSNSSERSLRMGALLSLRLLKNEAAALFLNDQDEAIATDAARAINDDFSIIPALPKLANCLKDPKYLNEPYLRRAINAALRIGDLDLLVNFVNNTKMPEAMRAEAIATLSSWDNPSVLDRVDGRYRGEIKRDKSKVISSINKILPSLLNEDNAQIKKETIALIGELGIKGQDATLIAMYKEGQSPEIKVEALNSLVKLDNPNLEQFISDAMRDKNSEVRIFALSQIKKLNLSSSTLLDVTNSILKNGALKEQQQLIASLGSMPIAKSQESLEYLLNLYSKNEFPSSLKLDFEETIEASKSEILNSQLAQIKKSDNPLDAFQSSLEGGNRREGYQIFNYNETAQCVRCHQVRGAGGTVGPDLTHIGSTLSRQEILDAIIDPSKRLAPGYGSVNIVLKNGQEVFGVLMKEDSEELEIKTSDAEPTRIPVERIAKRENFPSGMPDFSQILNKREVRDLVEYLSSLN